MERFVTHIINNNTFTLSSNRLIFWEEKRTLILSDLHLGKTGHFRKSGIAIPQNIFKEDMHRLVDAIQFFKPDNVIIVGDLFHSKLNKEMDLFVKWRNDLHDLPIQLVKGNHDILTGDWYAKANIEVIQHHLIIDDFYFTHDVWDTQHPEKHFIFSGHVHPSIIIKGIARQALRLPCFYFTNTYAVLPAFGKFTGSFSIKPDKTTSVYAIMPANISKGEKGGIMKI